MQPDDSAPLDADDVQRLQEVVGTILSYGRAVDYTTLPALSSIASEQANGTEATMRALVRLLDYVATHPDAVLRFRRSGMILTIHADGSYLSAPRARSRVASFFCLSEAQPEQLSPDDPPARLNGGILVISRILKAVMGSAFEVEVGATYVAGQAGCPLRDALTEMGHSQPPAPAQTDNSTAAGFANDDIRQRHSRAIDMRFYWVKDRVRQNQHRIHWKRGEKNYADYFSKHHNKSVHIDERPTYLHVDGKSSS